MRSVDRKFYETKAWKTVRRNVWLKQKLLCNRCHRPVYVYGITDYIPKGARLKGIVHHKVYLNSTNIYDTNITLNEDNLEGLCIDCHNKEHNQSEVTRSDLMFDENGDLIQK